jgi:hypothetical protein
MCISLAIQVPGVSVAWLITDAPHGVVVLGFVVLVALVVFVPWVAFRRLRRGEPQQEIKRIDPVFGEVRYNPEILYWRGRVLFAPLDREVAVDVGDDDEGPFASQRAWYQELEQRYPALQSEVQQVVQSSPSCSETFDRLQLDRINFPDHPTEDVEFALGYTSTSARWAYWVTVENWTPVSLVRVRKKIWDRI